MILVKSEIENMNVTVEIDENGDHHKWSGCPSINCEGNFYVFESCDVLAVVKAVKTSETVEEFIEKVSGDATWKKEKLAEPIIEAINKKVVDNVKKDVIGVLDYSFTEANKDLFGFDVENENCLNPCLNHYANEFEGRFDKLDKCEQIRYLVQSALADC